jgi:hypothetical protein
MLHPAAACMLPAAPVVRVERQVPGWRDRRCHLPNAVRTDTPEKSPTHSPTSMRNLAALKSDRRFGRKLTMVGVPPRRFNANTGGNCHAIDP